MVGSVVGLDFGTTNSLVAFVDAREERVRTLTNREDLRPHPSTVWYRAGSVIVGREARSQLEGNDIVSGSFVRSPKRLLDRESPVDVDGTPMSPESIVADVLRFLREDAAVSREGLALNVERAVLTIPVDLDGAGRRRLRAAARKAGVRVVQFVHEPLAALYAWLRSQPDHIRKAAELEGRRILVFDWGGGTLDLTLCLIRNGRLVQIANAGDNEVGGDFFDAVVRNHVRQRHAEEHAVPDVLALETAESSRRLLVQCEQAKIALSSRESTRILLRNYLRGDHGQILNMTISRSELAEWTRPLIERGLAQIDRLLEEHGLTHQEIELCLPTGGMVNVPAVREGLTQRFGVRAPHISNGDSIIAEGAAWIAHDGLRLSLAKPFELEQPGSGFLELVPEGHRLPIENEVQPITASQFYCVDPRDGAAHFHFARPEKLGYGARNARRRTYAYLTVRVDPFQRPFIERLKVDIKIDHDFIVEIKARSTGRADERTVEVHDLEFALDLPGAGRGQASSDSDQMEDDRHRSLNGANVALRSNVAAVNGHGDWSLVPGDVVDIWRSEWFDSRSSHATQRQLIERNYYRPCALCKRSLCEIELHGCDTCKSTLSIAAAAERRAARGVHL